MYREPYIYSVSLCFVCSSISERRGRAGDEVQASGGREDQQKDAGRPDVSGARDGRKGEGRRCQEPAHRHAGEKDWPTG